MMAQCDGRALHTVDHSCAMAQTDLDSGAAPWVLHGRPSQVSMATFHHSGGSNIYSDLLKYPFKRKSMYICIYQVSVFPMIPAY